MEVIPPSEATDRGGMVRIITRVDQECCENAHKAAELLMIDLKLGCAQGLTHGPALQQQLRRGRITLAATWES
jgi:hypothetical protein